MKICIHQISRQANGSQNWPLWQRDLILGILSFVAVVAATTSPLLAADSVTLAIYFVKTFTDSALLTGYHLCGVGVAGFLFVASARVWGKRHLFLLGCILMIVSSAWGGSTVHSVNYKSLLWARVFQGVALAPFEALLNACVGDLFYLHERSTRAAICNVALFGGAFFTPVLVGKITHTLGWQWSFYFIAIFMGAALPLLLLCVPETAYTRAAYLNTDMEQAEDIPKSQDSLHTARDIASPDGSACPSHEKNHARKSTFANQCAQKDPFLRRILPFNGRKTDESFWKLLFRPFPLFFHPGILWACLIQGVIIGWTVMIGVVIAAVFLGPPLFFDEVQTGYLYVGAFIGSMAGLVLSALFSDWVNKIMIRWNKGKYEPEFRILLVLPMLVFTAMGLYGFGITSQNVTRYGWLIPEVFLMFVIIGMVMGAVASALYIIDAHRELAVEAFTCLLIFKNMFSFVLTYFAYDWVFAGGIRRVFIIIASIQVAICLLSIPMYIFGKRNRSFFYRHDLLKLTHLR